MNILDMDRAMFEKMIGEEKKTVLVDYWAPWCVYCRRIAPALDKIAAQYDGQILIAKVNIDAEPELAQKEEIEIIPTMVVYKDGKAAASIVAPDSKAKIEELIAGYLQ